MSSSSLPSTSLTQNLVFTYNYDDLCQFNVTSPGCGANTTSTTAYGPCTWEGTGSTLSNSLFVQQVQVPDSSAPDELTNQIITFTITCTDQTDPNNPNTLGVLQFTTQIIQPKFDTLQTISTPITSNASTASGIFTSYLNKTVTISFDNVDGDRTITFVV
jgi:hypothetical protein